SPRGRCDHYLALCRHRGAGALRRRCQPGGLSAPRHLCTRRRRQAAGRGPHTEAPAMMKLWMAPGGLHIEPAETGDAPELARIHAQSFYRGWPAHEFAGLLGDAATPAYIACDARRRIAGFALIRIAADEAEL